MPPIPNSLPDRPLKRLSEQGRKALQGSNDFPIRPVDPVHPPPRQTRDDIEKSRLKERVECFTRYESINQSINQPNNQSNNQSKRPNPGIHKSVVDAPVIGEIDFSTGKLLDQFRYDSHIVLEQKLEKQSINQSVNQSINQRRARAEQYESDRWQKMTNQSNNQSNNQKSLQESLTAGKKNQSSVPIDLINQSYQSNNQGIDLQLTDQSIKYRAACRSHHLDKKSNSEFNPITNQPRKSFPEPNKPPRRPSSTD